MTTGIRRPYESPLVPPTEADFHLASDERLDCAVWAIATALRAHYSEAHELLARHGRKPRHRTKRETMAAAMREIGSRVAIHRQYSRRRPQLQTFLREHQVGSYIVRVNGHILALVDGVIFEDAATSPGRLVKAYWKIGAGI